MFTDTQSFNGLLNADDQTVQLALNKLDNVVVGGGGTDDQTAAEVPVTASGFDGNLTTGATTAQLAFQELDDLAIGVGGSDGVVTAGTYSAGSIVLDRTITGDVTIVGIPQDDQTASEVPVTASGFDGNLTTAATNVQVALQEVDDLTLPVDPATVGAEG